MAPVRYFGAIPKTLRAYADRHADKIQEVSWDGGYLNGGAYDAVLRPGWREVDNAVHTLIGSTVRELIAELRGIVPCACPDCVERSKGVL